MKARRAKSRVHSMFQKGGVLSKKRGGGYKAPNRMPKRTFGKATRPKRLPVGKVSGGSIPQRKFIKTRTKASNRIKGIRR